MDKKQKYKCQDTDCNWIGTEEEMFNEYDFGFDQMVCPECNGVMLDILHGREYAIKLVEMNNTILTEEYNEWISKFGNGRNNDDIRFGQHIWNKYPDQMRELFGDDDYDGFHKEKANEAYTIIYHKINI